MSEQRNTIYCEIHDIEQDMEIIQQAARIIQSGGLVAFPTETVYGLGADGLNETAVKKIYAAKGRPSDNPLILHIAEKSDVYALCEDVPELAKALMDQFWPGPLTIVLKKKSHIPHTTSGGLDTVGIRLPSNYIARALIKAAGVPIAAPSANSSGKPSPTRASHVKFDLDGKIDMIIDGGSADFGLESTIVEVTKNEITLLRPGSITLEMLEEVVGHVQVDSAVSSDNKSEKTKPRAPGMKYTHYSPAAKVTLVTGDPKDIVRAINILTRDKQNVGVLATEQTIPAYVNKVVLSLGDREKPETIAANLFKMLRRCDHLALEQVFAEGFLETDLGLAIMNRLKKASGYELIEARSVLEDSE